MGKIIKLTYKLLHIILLGLLSLWCFGYFYFLSSISKTPDHKREHTDVIVIFSEKKQNITIGAQLLKAGYTSLVFFTGNNKREDFTNFFSTNQLAPEQFIFDTELTNDTHKLATDTANFLSKYKLDSARIVANAEQMPRAMLEIKSKITDNKRIIPHPVTASTTNYLSLAQEYIKYSIMLVCYTIGYYGISFSYA